MMGMTLLTDRAAAHRMDRAGFERWREERSEDRCRYELLKGEVLVTPAPATDHQIVSMALVLALAPLVQAPLRLLTAPLDVALPTTGGDTVLQPDLVVVRRSDVAPRAVEGPPVLAVEILSPSTWRRDLGSKRDTYAEVGVEHYWVVSPTIPSLTIYRLVEEDGQRGYAEVAHVEGSAGVTLTEPYEITLRPADLLH